MKAIYNGQVIAESEKIERVEGNVYFPPEGVKFEFLKESPHRTTCFWKGEASYYNLDVDGALNENAAWSYPDPSEKAEAIRGYVAFWKGVTVK